MLYPDVSTTIYFLVFGGLLASALIFTAFGIGISYRLAEKRYRKETLNRNLEESETSPASAHADGLLVPLGNIDESNESSRS